MNDIRSIAHLVLRFSGLTDKKTNQERSARHCISEIIIMGIKNGWQRTTEAESGKVGYPP